MNSAQINARATSVWDIYQWFLSKTAKGETAVALTAIVVDSMVAEEAIKQQTEAVEGVRAALDNIGMHIARHA